MITVERANAIAEAIGNEEQEAKKIVDMSPEEASAYLKSKGFECTAGELIDFAELVKKTVANGTEINEDDLENVSGGSVAACVFLGGVVIGMILNKRNIW